MGFNLVKLEMDSACAYEFISSGVSNQHASMALVNSIRNLMQNNWKVEIHHIYRKASCCAENAAKHGLNCTVGFHIFPAIPPLMSLLYLADVIGLVRPRIIAV